MTSKDLKELRNHRRNTAVPTCVFCGKSARDGVNIVVGVTGLGICNECASNALNIMEDKPESQSDMKGTEKQYKDIPTPKEIVRRLDEHVIGQDSVKKVLATAVYNHYTRLNLLSSQDDEDLKETQVEKSNIVMIGPTGCGKTLLAKTIAKILDVPFAIADATTLTEAGYVGEDVENVVRYLYNNADGDVKKTERGIIWIDECDKIARKTQNVSITRDVSGEGVQQALLKIIEGTICRFPQNGGRKHPDQKYIEVDTSNILFICGGAFVGLDKIVENRIKNAEGENVIGFGVGNEGKPKNKSNRFRPEDLVEFGLIPEFVGRLPIIAAMKELSEEELVRVLKEPKNSITKQYRKLLKQSNVDLKFDEEALRKLAKRAIERKTGARGLRAEMEEVMQDIMFNAPDNKTKRETIIVNAEMVDKVA